MRATTGIVAVQNGRKYIGIELNPEYIELANRRYAEAVGLDGVSEQCLQLPDTPEMPPPVAPNRASLDSLFAD